MELGKEELLRYSRQLVLPEVGSAGQQKLKAAKVAVVGAGGLGTPVLGYLAAAGVGELGVFDYGGVEVSNLQRQLLYNSSDVGRRKTELARRRLLELNPNIKVKAAEGELKPANMASALRPYQYVADCTDNFTARAAINRACLELDRVCVYGAVSQFEGQLAVFEPRRGPCLECACPGLALAESQTCAEAGIMGPVAGAVASMQALEILKLILGMDTLKGRFALLDFRHMQMSVAEMKKDPACPVCGTGPERRFLESVEPAYITPAELKARLAAPQPPRLVDLRYDWERGLVRIPGDEWLDLDALLKDGAGLNTSDEIVLYCKGQSKSTAAFRRLRALGFGRVKVLRGGMDAWTAEVDKTLPRY